MLFQHDPSELVGVWLDMKEDLRGLWARGRLIPDVTRARELLALLQAGAVDGLSIGYRTQRGQIEPKTRVRKLYQGRSLGSVRRHIPAAARRVGERREGCAALAPARSGRTRLDPAHRPTRHRLISHRFERRRGCTGAGHPAWAQSGRTCPGLFNARPRRSQTRAARRRRPRPVRRALRTTRRAAMRAQNSLLIVTVIAWVWVRAAAVPTMVPWLVVPPVPFGLVNGLA